MIARLLDALSGRVGAADAVMKVDDTLTLAISADGETRIGRSRSRISHLRVVREGRAGYAFSTGNDAGELVGHALTASASGGEIELFLPAPAPLPDVATRAPQAASAEVPALEALARALLHRLRQTGRRIEVWAERAVGLVQVGSTRGVQAGYETTLAGIGAVVESIGAGSAPPCRVHTAATDLPSLPDVEALVSEVNRRLAPRILEPARPLPATMATCLSPRAAATFLRPLRAALTGREALLGSSPLRGKLGERVFDERLSIVDDPLAPWRPGSRPIDDDGVISRRLPLIERGRLVGFLVDLEVGARANVPSTGHGWRLPAAAPRVGFTNLRVAPGIEGLATLLTMMGRGLLIEDLEWSGGPNPLSGSLSLRAPWCYLVEGGVVQGRLEGVTLTGNAFKALSQLAAVGNDATWIGACCLPSLLLEGLTVRQKI